ncbi:unnamed protein product [Calicophoron daubneyi]|uniref:Serine/threonine-protein kinase ATR n=1 Tax=Calicophoron daubneyi TaxID=300641 RepID=A0AAV2TRA4_CALDB
MPTSSHSALSYSISQRALEAVFHGVSTLYISSSSSCAGSSVLPYLLNSVSLSLLALSDWFEGRLAHLKDETLAEEYSGLEQVIIRCLTWLANERSRTVGREDSIGNAELYSRDRMSLLSMCDEILQSSWILDCGHNSLRRATLIYLLLNISVPSVYSDLDELPFAKSLLDSSFGDSMNESLEPSIFYQNYSFYDVETTELKLDSFLGAYMRSSSQSLWRNCLHSSLDSNLSGAPALKLAAVWIRSARFWGGINILAESHSEIRSELVEPAVQAIKHVVLFIRKPDDLPDSAVESKAVRDELFSVYGGLRLIGNCLVLLKGLSQENVLGETLLSSIFGWLEDYSKQIKSRCQSLRGLVVRLACVLSVWCCKTNAVSADRIQTLLNPLAVPLFREADEYSKFWIQPLIENLRPNSPDSDFYLTFTRGLLRELMSGVCNAPFSRHCALLVADLSARVVCMQSACASESASLYCPGGAYRASPENIADEAEETDRTRDYSFSEYFVLLNLLLETRNLDSLFEVAVDVATHFSCHVTWETITPDKLENFFTLIQSNLPHFPPPLVGKIYGNVASRLSGNNIGKWLPIHAKLMNILAVPPKHGPSSSLDLIILHEYSILQLGSLANCLAKHYGDLLSVRPDRALPGEYKDRRTSSEDAATSSVPSCLADALIVVVASLCRTALTYQYAHALFGSVYVQIQKVIKSVRMKSAHVVRLCRDKLAQVLADYMDQAVTPAIENLSRLFQLNKITLFKELISPLFIALVIRGNQESHLLIRKLVAEVPYIRTNQDYINKIVQLCVLPDALVYIFTRTSDDECEAHLAFLQTHLSMPIERIARLNDVSRLMHQFVLHLFPYRVGACLGLHWVSSRVLLPRDSPATPPTRGSAKSPASADFLGHYVCGILAFFDSTLLDDDTMLEQRWIALRSLAVFIQLIGSRHVTRMRAKFMATLKICLRYKAPPFSKVVIKVWRSFIRILEPDALKELLPDLGATLVGLLPCGCDQVADLFDYLFLKKRDELGDRLSCLFFLPRVPKLLTCQQILDDVCSWRSFSVIDNSALPEAQIRALLSAWLSALRHSSRSVRRLGLTSELSSAAIDRGASFRTSRLWGLTSLLQNPAPSFVPGYCQWKQGSNIGSTLSGGNTELDGDKTLLLTDLISALLEGLARDTDEKMRLLYAQWIGYLGSIDPSRVCSPSSCARSSDIQSVYVHDRKFSSFVLCELAKIYLRAASPKQLDSTALAIQELLKFFSITEEVRHLATSNSLSATNVPVDGNKNSSEQSSGMPYLCGKELWTSFPEHLWDLFAPLVTSRYVVEAFTDWTTVQSPLITRRPDLTFESWVRLWAGSLCARITNQHAFRIFQFCEPVVKTDAGFARWILEHAALQVLIDNAKHGIELLQMEILAVLKIVAEAQDVSTGDHTMTDDLLLTTSLHESVSSEPQSPDRVPWKPWFSLSVQAVFGLLDHLRRWVREHQRAKQPAKQSLVQNQVTLQRDDIPSDVVKRVSDFLSTIPNLLQAKASLRCGGLARALLHWELAYGEDVVAQRSAYATGAAFIRPASDQPVADFRLPTGAHMSASHPDFVHEAVGSQGLKALDGLLDTYAPLRDSDGLAGVLAVSQLISDRPQSLNSKQAVPNALARSSFTQLSSTLRALELENEGQLEMAGAAYEHNLASLEDDSSKAAEAKRLLLYAGLFRCELSDPARLHGLVERAGALIRQDHISTPSFAPTSAWTRRLNAYRTEAAWRLSSWSSLRETANLDVGPASWSVDLGKLFLAIRDKHNSECSGIMKRLRLNQMSELSAAALEGPGGYARAYETIVRLSSLADVELIASFGDLVHRYLNAGELGSSAGDDPGSSSVDLQAHLESILNVLEERVKLSQPTFHTLEPCLAIQHAALQLVSLELQSLAESSSKKNATLNTLLDRIHRALGENWLRRASLTRKFGQFMAAYTCILRAESFGIPDALVEHAKLLWQADKREAAQAFLDKGIPDVYGSVLLNSTGKRTGDSSSTCLSESVRSPSSETTSAQQALLLRARYCEETNRFDFDTTRRLYQEVCDMGKGCEEAHFRLARFVEKAESMAKSTKQRDELIKMALVHYGLALSYGSQFIYQSMPRLLSLWLDYGTEFARSNDAVKMRHTSNKRAASDQQTFQEIQEIMRQNIEKIPPYQYYTALGQLLSRVCHEVPSVITTLIDLVVRIFEAYPLQTIWFLIPLHDSAIRQRRDRCQQIFNSVKSRKPKLSKFITDSITLCNHLRTICGLFMEADRRELRSFSLCQTMRPLTRLVESSDFSRILIPIHRQLVPNLLPARSHYECVQKHCPFGTSVDNLVCLARMEDSVDILGSQTRPKKMTWIGSDGKRYIIVAKPNDDLRKDSRLMELNGIINKFLIKNPETRRRALQIRTYAVIPLSEKGGLIEWVSNTEPFRAIITRLYNESGRPINWTNMSRVAPLQDDPLPVKRDKYLNQWLPMFPLVFYRWFLDTFTNPTAWYSAREFYARTCAVMSMVGYVLGLGDRHTENILLDSTTGGVVHVDFSCVFNNGLTLPWPERVPFRLTRNMVHAMGPTGYEGIFRRSAEAVMRLLRHEIDPLLAVFRPLYFDALVEQGGNTRGPGTGSDNASRCRRTGSDDASTALHDITERVARAAAEKLKGMEDRLNGKITEHDSLSQILPMSAEGQVDALIKEATDVDQLCQMYKGWMPFL